jgi:hypothetical protein
LKQYLFYVRIVFDQRKYSKRMGKFFDFFGFLRNKAEKKRPNFSKSIDGRKSMSFKSIINY